MIRISLCNSTGEPIDFFEVADEVDIAPTLCAKIDHPNISEWVLAPGDTIKIEEVPE